MTALGGVRVNSGLAELVAGLEQWSETGGRSGTSAFLSMAAAAALAAGKVDAAGRFLGAGRRDSIGRGVRAAVVWLGVGREPPCMSGSATQSSVCISIDTAIPVAKESRCLN